MVDNGGRDGRVGREGWEERREGGMGGERMEGGM